MTKHHNHQRGPHGVILAVVVAAYLALTILVPEVAWWPWALGALAVSWAISSHIKSAIRHAERTAPPAPRT